MKSLGWGTYGDGEFPVPVTALDYAVRFEVLAGMSETEEHFDEDVLLNGPLHEYLRACGDPTTPLNCATPTDPDPEVLKATWKIIPIESNELFKSAKLVSYIVRLGSRDHGD
jgi:hypothetical protein